MKITTEERKLKKKPKESKWEDNAIAGEERETTKKQEHVNGKRTMSARNRTPRNMEME